MGTKVYTKTVNWSNWLLIFTQKIFVAYLFFNLKTKIDQKHLVLVVKVSCDWLQLAPPTLLTLHVCVCMSGTGLNTGASTSLTNGLSLFPGDPGVFQVSRRPSVRKRHLPPPPGSPVVFAVARAMLSLLASWASWTPTTAAPSPSRPSSTSCPGKRPTRTRRTRSSPPSRSWLEIRSEPALTSVCSLTVNLTPEQRCQTYGPGPRTGHLDCLNIDITMNVSHQRSCSYFYLIFYYLFVCVFIIIFLLLF